MKSYGYFSQYGGVGKTSLSTSIAHQLVNEGNKVCLLDLDLYAPNLWVGKIWINDYLFANENIEACLIDSSNELNLEDGQIFIGYANPNSTEIEKVLQMNNTMALQMLKRLLILKEKIELAPYSIDYFLVDSPPGLNSIALNCMLITDRSYFIMNFLNSDLLGKMSMEEEKYTIVKDRIVNRIESEILEMKIMENIKLNDVEKVGRLTGGEIEGYLDIIANDSELKQLLD